MIIRAQSACEPGWTPFNGNVEVSALNPLQDGRPPTNLAAASANGLPSCAGGTVWMRVGRERHTTGEFDYFRGFWRFPLSGGPSSAASVRFKLGIAPSLSGVFVSTGSPELYWLDFTGPFPAGPANGRGVDFPQYFTPPIRELVGPADVNIVMVNATDYTVDVDVTSQYNQAKTLGLSDIWFGIRLTDEADESNTEPTYFTVVTAEFPLTEYRPHLIITTPAPQTVVPAIVSAEVNILEPCVAERGFNLIDSRQRQDFEIERRLHHVPRGNIVNIEIRVRDNRLAPGLPPRPAPTALLTLIAQDGTVVLTDAEMTLIAPGQYRYGYQTQFTDPLGVYTARVVLE